MGTASENLEIAKRWLACFARKDVDALVSLYHPDARHTSPKLRVQRPDSGGFIIGRPSLRAWWAEAFERLPQLQYVEQSLTADGERVFMEYTRRNPGEPDLPVAEVLEIRGALIVASRVFHG